VLTISFDDVADLLSGRHPGRARSRDGEDPHVPYLVAAVLAVGVLGLLNLLLTVGVIRRLRRIAEHPGAAPHGLHGELPPVGAVVTDFTGSATDDTLVSRDALGAVTLVGFFSPGCPPCEEAVPAFADAARVFPGGASRVVAVVEGTPEAAAPMLARLAPGARVVVEPRGASGLVSAFGVTSFPAVVLVDAEGRIEWSGPGVTALPVPVA